MVEWTVLLPSHTEPLKACHVGSGNGRMDRNDKQSQDNACCTWHGKGRSAMPSGPLHSLDYEGVGLCPPTLFMNDDLQAHGD